MKVQKIYPAPEKLAERLQRRKLSPEAFAAMMGVPRWRVRGWLNPDATGEIKPEQLVNVARILRCRMIDALPGDYRPKGA